MLKYWHHLTIFDEDYDYDYDDDNGINIFCNSYGICIK